MKYLLNLFALLLFMAMSSCGGNSSLLFNTQTLALVANSQNLLQ